MRRTVHAETEAALDRHAMNHGGVSASCPLCIQMTINATIIVGNDGFGRTIAQVKEQRLDSGYAPGDVVDLAHFQRVCPHGVVFRGETCLRCGRVV